MPKKYILKSPYGVGGSFPQGEKCTCCNSLFNMVLFMVANTQGFRGVLGQHIFCDVTAGRWQQSRALKPAYVKPHKRAQKITLSNNPWTRTTFVFAKHKRSAMLYQFWDVGFGTSVCKSVIGTVEKKTTWGLTAKMAVHLYHAVDTTNYKKMGCFEVHYAGNSFFPLHIPFGFRSARFQLAAQIFNLSTLKRKTVNIEVQRGGL